MRGTLDSTLSAVVAVRIIPAHAGNSRQYTLCSRRSTDHPRACGELSSQKPLLILDLFHVRRATDFWALPARCFACFDWSDSVRMSVAGVGRFVISAPPLDPRSVAAAPDPTISGPAVGRATAHHGRALRRFSATKRCTKMREGTSRGHSGPDHVADVLASLHCAHEAIGESAPPLVQHPGDLAGSSRLCEPAETTPLARAERAAHSATADPEDTRRHFGVRHHGERVVRGPERHDGPHESFQWWRAPPGFDPASGRTTLPG